MQRKLAEYKFDLSIESPVSQKKITEQIVPLLDSRKSKIFDSCEFQLNYSAYHSNVMRSLHILSNSQLNSFNDR